MNPLPAPDQPAATAAAAAANAARDSVVAQLSAGTMTLDSLFSLVDGETKPVLGHMHLRAALIALPKIGEVKADKIIADLGLKSDEHLDVLGSQQRKAIAEALAA